MWDALKLHTSLYKIDLETDEETGTSVWVIEPTDEYNNVVNATNFMQLDSNAFIIEDPEDVYGRSCYILDLGNQIRLNHPKQLEIAIGTEKFLGLLPYITQIVDPGPPAEC